MPVPLPVLFDVDIVSVGADLGDSLITVISSSVKATPLNVVCVLKFVDPDLNDDTKVAIKNGKHSAEGTLMLPKKDFDNHENMQHISSLFNLIDNYF